MLKKKTPREVASLFLCYVPKSQVTSLFSLIAHLFFYHVANGVIVGSIALITSLRHRSVLGVNAFRRERSKRG